MKKEQPIVTLIGRTNVGKSTIFNKMTENKSAITSKIPGTTRDKKAGTVLWLGQTFTLVDTAGLDVESQKKIDIQAIEQAKKAAQKSDINLLVVDVKEGLMPQDKEYAKMLKQLKKPVILVINKVDSLSQMKLVHEFQKLGLGQPQTISAVTGAGTGDLLDELLMKLKGKLVESQVSETMPDIKVAIVGKPNVGKSSLLNRIVGEERVIVSELPHTTRDSQDITIEVDDKKEKKAVTFIDTAGIRKKGKIDTQIEKMSVLQSLRNIKRADIVLFVLDAAEPVTTQDKNISREILEQHKSLILVVNKWDLVEDKDTKSDKDFINYLHRSFPYLTWATIVFVSAKTGFKIQRLLNLIFELQEKQTKKIDDKELAQLLKSIIKKQPPRKTKGLRPPFIHQIKYKGGPPQTFEIFADQPKNLHFSYRRFIQNQLREKFDLTSVGIRLIMRGFNKTKKHQTQKS